MKLNYNIVYKILFIRKLSVLHMKMIILFCEKCNGHKEEGIS